MLHLVLCFALGGRAPAITADDTVDTTSRWWSDWPADERLAPPKAAFSD